MSGIPSQTIDLSRFDKVTRMGIAFHLADAVAEGPRFIHRARRDDWSDAVVRLSHGSDWFGETETRTLFDDSRRRRRRLVWTTRWQPNETRLVAARASVVRLADVTSEVSHVNVDSFLELDGIIRKIMTAHGRAVWQPAPAADPGWVRRVFVIADHGASDISWSVGVSRRLDALFERAWNLLGGGKVVPDLGDITPRYPLPVRILLAELTSPTEG